MHIVNNNWDTYIQQQHGNDNGSDNDENKLMNSQMASAAINSASAGSKENQQHKDQNQQRHYQMLSADGKKNKLDLTMSSPFTSELQNYAYNQPVVAGNDLSFLSATASDINDAQVKSQNVSNGASAYSSTTSTPTTMQWNTIELNPMSSEERLYLKNKKYRKHRGKKTRNSNDPPNAATGNAALLVDRPSKLDLIDNSKLTSFPLAPPPSSSISNMDQILNDSSNIDISFESSSPTRQQQNSTAFSSTMSKVNEQSQSLSKLITTLSNSLLTHSSNVATDNARSNNNDADNKKPVERNDPKIVVSRNDPIVLIEDYIPTAQISKKRMSVVNLRKSILNLRNSSVNTESDASFSDVSQEVINEEEEEEEPQQERILKKRSKGNLSQEYLNNRNIDCNDNLRKITYNSIKSVKSFAPILSSDDVYKKKQAFKNSIRNKRSLVYLNNAINLLDQTAQNNPQNAENSDSYGLSQFQSSDFLFSGLKRPSTSTNNRTDSNVSSNKFSARSASSSTDLSVLDSFNEQSVKQNDFNSTHMKADDGHKANQESISSVETLKLLVSKGSENSSQRNTHSIPSLQNSMSFSSSNIASSTTTHNSSSNNYDNKANFSSANAALVADCKSSTHSFVEHQKAESMTGAAAAAAGGFSGYNMRNSTSAFATSSPNTSSADLQESVYRHKRSASLLESLHSSHDNNSNKISNINGSLKYCMVCEKPLYDLSSLIQEDCKFRIFVCDGCMPVYNEIALLLKNFTIENIEADEQGHGGQAAEITEEEEHDNGSVVNREPNYISLSFYDSSYHSQAAAGIAGAATQWNEDKELTHLAELVALEVANSHNDDVSGPENGKEILQSNEQHYRNIKKFEKILKLLLLLNSDLVEETDDGTGVDDVNMDSDRNTLQTQYSENDVDMTELGDDTTTDLGDDTVRTFALDPNAGFSNILGQTNSKNMNNKNNNTTTITTNNNNTNNNNYNNKSKENNYQEPVLKTTTTEINTKNILKDITNEVDFSDAKSIDSQFNPHHKSIPLPKQRIRLIDQNLTVNNNNNNDNDNNNNNNNNDNNFRDYYRSVITKPSTTRIVSHKSGHRASSGSAFSRTENILDNDGIGEALLHKGGSFFSSDLISTLHKQLNDINGLLGSLTTAVANAANAVESNNKNNSKSFINKGSDANIFSKLMYGSSQLNIIPTNSNNIINTNNNYPFNFNSINPQPQQQQQHPTLLQHPPPPPPPHHHQQQQSQQPVTTTSTTSTTPISKLQTSLQKRQSLVNLNLEQEWANFKKKFRWRWRIRGLVPGMALGSGDGTYNYN